MAGESTLSLTYGTLLSTTLKKVLDSGALHDQVFDNDVFLQWLRSGNRIKKVDGGERMRIGLMFGKNTTAGWYSDYEALDTTAQAGMTSAFYNNKQASASVSVSGLELRSNKGASQITNLQQEYAVAQSGFGLGWCGGCQLASRFAHGLQRLQAGQGWC